jgi:hypothetical protein
MWFDGAIQYLRKVHILELKLRAQVRVSIQTTYLHIIITLYVEFSLNNWCRFLVSKTPFLS